MAEAIQNKGISDLRATVSRRKAGAELTSAKAMADRDAKAVRDAARAREAAATKAADLGDSQALLDAAARAHVTGAEADEAKDLVAAQALVDAAATTAVETFAAVSYQNTRGGGQAAGAFR
jgi:hypothetical protein